MKFEIDFMFDNQVCDIVYFLNGQKLDRVFIGAGPVKKLTGLTLIF